MEIMDIFNSLVGFVLLVIGGLFSWKGIGWVYTSYRDKRIQIKYDFLIDTIKMGSRWLELPSTAQILASNLITDDNDKELYSRLINLAMSGSSWTEFENIVLYFNNKAVIKGYSDMGHNTDVFKKVFERKRRNFIYRFLIWIKNRFNWIKRMKGARGYFIRTTHTGITLTRLEFCFNPTGKKNDLKIVRTIDWSKKKYLH